MLRVIRCANTIGVEGSRDELADLLVATARALREWGPWRVGGRGGACEFVEGGETTPGQRLTVEALDQEPRTSRGDGARTVARDVIRMLG